MRSAAREIGVSTIIRAAPTLASWSKLMVEKPQSLVGAVQAFASPSRWVTAVMRLPLPKMRRCLSSNMLTTQMRLAAPRRELLRRRLDRGVGLHDGRVCRVQPAEPLAEPLQFRSALFQRRGGATEERQLEGRGQAGEVGDVDTIAAGRYHEIGL